MTVLVDRAIDSLSALHDRLAALVEGLDEEQLVAPSAALDWRVCDVLSHLGSGAEIMSLTLAAAVEGTAPEARENQVVWDRWNAMSPRAQALSFVEYDATLVHLLTGVDGRRRGEVRVDLGFLPEPVPLEVAAGLRLNEVAQRTWDVVAGLEPGAPLDADAADVLLDLLAGSMGFMLGFTAKPDALDAPVEVDLADRTLTIGDGVRLAPGAPGRAGARFVGPPEAALRLLGGRLREDTTPDGVRVDGAVSLADLRRVFPGF